MPPASWGPLRTAQATERLILGGFCPGNPARGQPEWEGLGPHKKGSMAGEAALLPRARSPGGAKESTPSLLLPERPPGKVGAVPCSSGGLAGPPFGQELQLGLSCLAQGCPPLSKVPVLQAGLASAGAATSSSLMEQATSAQAGPLPRARGTLWASGREGHPQWGRWDYFFGRSIRVTFLIADLSGTLCPFFLKRGQG